MNSTLPRQAALRAFPSGFAWEVASLPKSPDGLRSELGVELQDDSDDLDSFSFVAFDDAEVGQVLLQSYHHPPRPLTLVLVDGSITRQQGLAAIRRVLGDVDLDWVTPLDRYGAELPGG